MRKIFFVALIAVIAVIALIALTGCNGNPPPDAADFPAADIVEIGAGERSFPLVVDHDGDISVFNVATDEETVGAALFAAGLIDGEETAFGLFVTTVNGITAEGNSWWAFWADGEPAQTGLAISGAGSTEIEYGVSYALVYTP